MGFCANWTQTHPYKLLPMYLAKNPFFFTLSHYSFLPSLLHHLPLRVLASALKARVEIYHLLHLLHSSLVSIDKKPSPSSSILLIFGFLTRGKNQTHFLLCFELKRVKETLLWTFMDTHFIFMWILWLGFAYLEVFGSFEAKCVKRLDKLV